MQEVDCVSDDAADDLEGTLRSRLRFRAHATAEGAVHEDGEPVKWLLSHGGSPSARRGPGRSAGAVGTGSRRVLPAEPSASALDAFAPAGFLTRLDEADEHEAKQGPEDAADEYAEDDRRGVHRRAFRSHSMM